MRITTAEIFQIRLPLISPFIVSYGTYTHVESIVLRLSTDTGLVGWGEATPDPYVTGETWSSAFAMLKHDLLMQIVGKDPLRRQSILAGLNRNVKGAQAARAAIDIALWDLAGKHCGVSIAALLGGPVRDQLPWHKTISIADPDQMADQARAAVAAGHDEIKMKVGSALLADDVARVMAVRQAAGDSVRLQIDANQGWRTPTIAIRAIRAIAPANPDWIEQAIAAEDLRGLAQIREATGIAQMVDEGALTAQDLLKVIELRCADLVNVKLMKSGGITEAVNMIAIAGAAGMRVMVGSMLEGSIASAAGVQIALAGEPVVANGLVGPTMLSNDVATGLRYSGGALSLDTSVPGLGVRVDEEQVKRFTVSGATVQAKT